MRIFAKIPPELADKELTEKIGVGLLYLALGEEPKSKAEPENEALRSTRFELSGDAEKYFRQLEPFYESRRALFRDALQYVKELPEHCRCHI